MSGIDPIDVAALRRLLFEAARLIEDEEDVEEMTPVERADVVLAHLEVLHQRVAELEEIVDPDPGTTRYKQLTRAQKVRRVRQTLVEKARNRSGKSKMHYDEVQALFGGRPSPGHCYDLMEQAGEMEGFDYDEGADDQAAPVINETENQQTTYNQKIETFYETLSEYENATAAGDLDREPLLTTRNGRLQKSTIRQYVYAWSRPCAIGADCPVGKDPDTCEAAQTNNAAYECPESVSPHPVRRGYITHLRANGVPTGDVISERCDATPDTIERWYDMSAESDRPEARRESVEDL